MDRDRRAVPAFASPPVGDDGIAAALGEGRPAMIVERPDVFGSRRAVAPLEVSGWAWSGSGIESVIVAVDDDVVVEALHDLFRPDLRRLLGDDLATSGFAVRIDARDWTPGAHKLTIVATDRDNRAIGVSGTVDSVAPEPPPASPDGKIDPLPDEPGGEYRRFVPSFHRGESLTPEHHARYQWAARAVEGVDVLDAGCGGGWGTALLAARARRATGVDLSPPAIAIAEREHGQLASFRQGDLLDLPFDDGEFDAVACFEAIEHVRDIERALDELHRVLRPRGVLLISSSNRGAYPEGNPLHLHELTATELRAALQARFADVAIHRQQTYVASLVCDDRALRHDDPREPIPATTTKATATAPGDEPYTVATATDGRQPDAPAQLALGTVLDEREQRRLVEAWEERCVEVETQAAEARSDACFRQRALSVRLGRLEATEAALNDRIAAVERELERTRSATTAMLGSASWRLTAPLRGAKRRMTPARSRAGRR